MRLISYHSETGPRVAGVRKTTDSTEYVDLNFADSSLPYCVKQLLAIGEVGLQKIPHAIATGKGMSPETVQLLPPIPKPGKIVCIGLNYVDHAAETGVPKPAEPVVFCKFPSTAIASGKAILLPKVSQRVDYEAELVVVIGKTGRDIPTSEWASYVAGYCCGNDVSARDWQKEKPAGQWLLGKSFDTFAPFGPELVLKDEVPDPSNLNIGLRLNGNTMQQSNTNQLIFPIPTLISYLSQVFTLEVGDILFTGTPGGVGDSRKPPVYLRDGDVVEVTIETIGCLKNPVCSAP